MIFSHRGDYHQPVLHHLQEAFAFLSLTQVKFPATSSFGGNTEIFMAGE